MDILIPIVIGFGLAFPVLILVTWRLKPDQRRFMLRLLWGAFLVRLAVSVVFAMVDSTRVYHEDAGVYEFWAVRIAKYWSGEGPPVPTWVIPDKNYGIKYVFAGFLYVFGAFPLNITVLNSLIGTLNAFWVYAIGVKLFNEFVARRAALLAAFFPSMIVWSSMALKDPLTSFLILVALFFCIRMRERFSLVNLLGALLPIVAIYPIRFYMSYFIGAAVVGTMALNRPGKRISGISKQLVLGLGIVALIAGFGLMGSTISDLNSIFDLEALSSYRRGMASTANSGFAQDVDIASPRAAIAFLPLGLSTLIWGPFPWQMVSLGPLLTLPEMLAWWYLTPALIRGIRHVVQKQFSLYSPIIVFSATLLVGLSLVMGNLGAAIRLRAQAFNLLFLFVTFGQYLRIQRRGKRAGEAPASEVNSLASGTSSSRS